MAIAVIVIVATLLALSISLTSQTSKKSTDVYLYEQAALLSHSAAEYALLKISQNPPCSDLNETFTQDTLYTIDIKLRYLYDSNAPCVANGGTLYTTVTSPEQNGSVLMDITVHVDDTTVASEPIRYFRRTLQKL
jgi:type II secretory pathway pseudopilin PulG